MMIVVPAVFDVAVVERKIGGVVGHDSVPPRDLSVVDVEVVA